jgi:hypothetical protein
MTPAEILIIVALIAMGVYFYREIQKNKAEARELRRRARDYVPPPPGEGDDEDDEEEEL